MTYTRLQNYTNIMMVGVQGIQIFEVVVVVLLLLLLFETICPHLCTTLADFGQVVYPNVLECSFLGQLAL